MTNKILEYWENQAKEYGNSSLATSPDTFAFNMETDIIKQYIMDNENVLDIGCGNGIRAIEILKQIRCKYEGIDFSVKMIDEANNNINNCKHSSILSSIKENRIAFRHGNILDKHFQYVSVFDKIISDRCLINLSSFEEQKNAINNIHSFLKPNGTYIMIENTIDGLENLNYVRASFKLDAISVRWHNCYFREEELLNFLDRLFIIDEINNFASTYYLISRTINAIVELDHQKGNYNSKINELASKLPSLGNYSPVKAFILHKK